MLLDLALVGFGHVGRRFVRLLDERRRALERDHDLVTRIVGLATRRHGVAFDPAGLDVARALAGVEAGESLDPLHARSVGARPEVGIDLIKLAAHHARRAGRPIVMVETTLLDIVRGQPAIDHVRAALAAGCHVVSTNKGPVALAYHDLRALADRAGLSFLFEGAVMDGVPVFNLVRHTVPAIEIQGFRGVLNSTTNHILTAMEEGGDFAVALADMQAQGIAEADPSLDVEGWDAAAKTAALANVLMGARTTPQEVERRGIGPDTAAAARQARAAGRRLRLVASAERRAARILTRVAPTELPETDALGGLRGMANALILQTDLLGDVMIAQLDGGLTQTAYALVSDLVEVRRRLATRREARPDRSP